MATTTRIAAPASMTGLYVEPWSQGEIYAVAADWAQASSPVMVYGEDGWINDECGRQVADFRHSDRAALEAVIRSAIEASGDEPDADEVEAILSAATDCVSAALDDMATMLERQGDLFAGNNVEDTAQDWLDHGFNADTAREWCAIGVWDASTAEEFRDADLTPCQVEKAADKLAAAEIAEWDAIDDSAAKDDDDSVPCDRNSQYTDNPIYSVCNCDTKVDEIIAAANDE